MICFSLVHDNAGRRIEFVPIKSLDSSEFSSEFSDLGTFSSNPIHPMLLIPNSDILFPYS